MIKVILHLLAQLFNNNLKNQKENNKIKNKYLHFNKVKLFQIIIMNLDNLIIGQDLTLINNKIFNLFKHKNSRKINKIKI